MLEAPYWLKFCSDQFIKRCVPNEEFESVLIFCYEDACGGHFNPKHTARKLVDLGLYLETVFRDTYLYCKSCD